MTAVRDVARIGLAAGAAVVSSATWYTAWGPQLAQLHEAYAGDAPPPLWIMPVELARSATVATAVSVLADRTRPAGLLGAARLGLGLWGAFPAVLLTGSVVHEKVPWKLAAIHGGDWLAKLLLISVVVGRHRSGLSG